MLTAQDVVIRSVLERNATDGPNRTLVSFEDGAQWTAAQALDAAYGAGQALATAGVRQGDRVAVIAPNGPGFLQAWWGTTALGAVMVAFNVAWKGEILRRALVTAAPRIVVVDEAVAGGLQAALAEHDVEVLTTAALASGAATGPRLDRPIELWDTHHIQFTSGTTGPSKAAVASYLQFHLTGSWVGEGLGFGPQDVVLCDLPLFHSGSLAVAASCITRGGQLAVRSAPSMTSYWAVAKEAKATFGFLVSSMAGFLLSREPSPDDRDHSVRAMLAAPLPPDVPAFCERFGVTEVVTAMGSSECSAPLVRVPGVPLVAGSCGRRRAPYHVRIVDEHDMEVPVGTPGELLVRSDLPWALTTHYHGDDAATAALWRNGWLHTGDQLRENEDGDFFFVDRVKDALRRRGENISSFEVEATICTHPAIQEVACVAVPAAGADDEVKVWLTTEPGADLDHLDLVRWLVDRMPHYMVPRYYELIEQMPRTASMRVRKVELRERGNGAGTWDLEAEGWKVTRNGLTPLDATS